MLPAWFKWSNTNTRGGLYQWDIHQLYCSLFICLTFPVRKGVMICNSGFCSLCLCMKTTGEIARRGGRRHWFWIDILSKIIFKGEITRQNKSLSSGFCSLLEGMKEEGCKLVRPQRVGLNKYLEQQLVKTEVFFRIQLSVPGHEVRRMQASESPHSHFPPPLSGS